MRGPYLILIILSLFITAVAGAQDMVYEVQSGSIAFHSTAPKELISATSGKVRGVVDIRRRTFAFKVEMATFQGFNTPLQREHFNENYMETTRYPDATFSGKIIEEPDLTRDGTYVVRAKGRLQVHGLVQDRVIKSTIVVKGGKLTIDADFTVALADHNIKIPRIVYDKLAPEISVSIHTNLLPRR